MPSRTETTGPEKLAKVGSEDSATKQGTDAIGLRTNKALLTAIDFLPFGSYYWHIFEEDTSEHW